MKMLNEILNEDIDEQSMIAAREYLPAVRPLYTVNDRFGPELKASCILFSIDTVHLLITASHVFENLEGSAIYLGGASRLVHIKGQHFRTKPSGTAVDDKYDLAFTEIDADTLTEIGNVRFLHSDDVDPNDIAAKKYLYLILGYPETKNRRMDYERLKAILKPFIFASNTPEPAIYQQLNFPEESHILLNFDRKNITDKDHRVTIAPDPHGLSGGGIWRIRDYSNVGSIAGPSNKKLVGIITEWKPEMKLIIGVRISCIIEGIRHQYPHLNDRLPPSNRISAHINRKF
jgi:hypothetical protein